jgi:D-arabinose 1-dehydrogenase-like Zn-dependent alcohol dehydrogenase
MRPARLNDITRTIPFDELPRAFDTLLKGEARGRIVVDLAS